MSEDAKLTTAARKVIIGNWFDISLIRVRAIRGVIHLQGHVTKTGGATTDLKQVEAGLRKMDDSLRSLKGFRGIAYLFDNWIRESTGGWRFVGPKAEREAAKKKG